MSIPSVSGNLSPPQSYPQTGAQGNTSAPPSPQQNSQATGVAGTSAPATPIGNDEAVKQAVKKVNDFVTTQTSDVQFSIDKSTDIRVIKVVDVATNTVIRQIPSEEILQLAQSLDRLQGLIVRQQA